MEKRLNQNAISTNILIERYRKLNRSLDDYLEKIDLYASQHTQFMEIAKSAKKAIRHYKVQLNRERRAVKKEQAKVEEQNKKINELERLRDEFQGVQIILLAAIEDIKLTPDTTEIDALSREFSKLKESAWGSIKQLDGIPKQVTNRLRELGLSEAEKVVVELNRKLHEITNRTQRNPGKVKNELATRLDELKDYIKRERYYNRHSDPIFEQALVGTDKSFAKLENEVFQYGLDEDDAVEKIQKWFKWASSEEIYEDPKVAANRAITEFQRSFDAAVEGYKEKKLKADKAKVEHALNELCDQVLDGDVKNIDELLLKRPELTRIKALLSDPVFDAISKQGGIGRINATIEDSKNETSDIKEKKEQISLMDGLREDAEKALDLRKLRYVNELPEEIRDVLADFVKHATQLGWTNGLETVNEVIEFKGHERPDKSEVIQAVLRAQEPVKFKVRPDGGISSSASWQEEVASYLDDMERYIGVAEGFDRLKEAVVEFKIHEFKFEDYVKRHWWNTDYGEAPHLSGKDWRPQGDER